MNILEATLKTEYHVWVTTLVNDEFDELCIKVPDYDEALKIAKFYVHKPIFYKEHSQWHSCVDIVGVPSLYDADGNRMNPAMYKEWLTLHEKIICPFKELGLDEKEILRQAEEAAA